MPSDSNRVGFFRRAVALFVDAVFVLLLCAAARLATEDQPRPRQEILNYVILLAYSSTEFLFGASPGKRLLRIRIISQAPGSADRWRLFLRWSTKFAPWIIGLVYSLVVPNALIGATAGFMQLIVLCGTLPALNDDRLAWHDQWSGTCVVRASTK